MNPCRCGLITAACVECKLVELRGLAGHGVETCAWCNSVRPSHDRNRAYCTSGDTLAYKAWSGRKMCQRTYGGATTSHDGAAMQAHQPQRTPNTPHRKAGRSVDVPNFQSP